MMGAHPALSLAYTLSLAAEELRSYIDPTDPFPAPLREDEYQEVLGRVHGALEDIGTSLRHIATATASGKAQDSLAYAASLISTACVHTAQADVRLDAARPKQGGGESLQTPPGT